MGNRKSLIIALFILIAWLCLFLIFIVGNKTKTKKPNINSNNKNIITFEKKTGQYDYDYEGQYCISNKNELKKFYSRYSIKLNINEEYLKNNIILIKVEQTGSGSNKFKLKGVIFNNDDIKFDIKRKYPKVGTDDMARWYFVAIIPKHYIDNINFKKWKKIK